MSEDLGLDVLHEALVDEAHLHTDLGIDSLDDIEMVMAIEERWDLDVPESVRESWRTFGDVVEWLERQG